MGPFERNVLLILLALLLIPLLHSATAWTGPEIDVVSPEQGQVVGSTDLVVMGTTAHGSTVTWVEEGAQDLEDGAFNNTTMAGGSVHLDTVPLPGVFGGGAEADDDTDTIHYSSADAPSGVTATFEVFLWFDQTPAHNTAVFEGYAWGVHGKESTVRLKFWTTNDTIRFDYHTMPGWVWYNLFAPVPSAGAWHHVACQVGTGGARLYVDGELVDSNSVPRELTDLDGASLGHISDNVNLDTALVRVDEFRVSTTLRYGGDFTPPTRALNTDSDTLVLDHLDGSTVGTNGGFVLEELADEGSYVSSPHDALAPVVHLMRVDWTSVLPAGSDLAVYLRWAGEEGDLNGSAWTPVTSPGGVSLPAAARFLQYRVDLGRDGPLSPRLSRFVLEYGGVLEVRASLDGIAWVKATGTETWSVELTAPGEGIVTAYVAAFDVAGNMTLAAVTVVIDVSSPTGYVEVAGGADLTRNRTVPVRLTVHDANPISYMKVSEDPGLADADWRPFKGTFEMPLSAGDGPKTVHVVVRDVAGHESEVMSDTVTLDTTPPRGEVVLGDGSGVTWKSSIEVHLDISDDSGVARVRVGEAERIDDLTWLPWSDTLDVDLGQEEGTRTVVVDAMDAAGNVARFSRQVLLDLHDLLLSVQLAEGAEFVSGDTVPVHLEASDANGVVAMRSAPDRASLEDAPWVPFSPAYILDAGETDGPVEHWVQARDGANRTAVAWDTTVVDRLPPTGSVVVGTGEGVVHSVDVTLKLEAADGTSGVAHVMVSNSASFSGAEEMEPVDEMEWTLPAGEGEHAVHYMVVDRAGLSSVHEAVVVLNTVPPAGTVSIGEDIVGAPSVTVHLTWEGAVEMWLSEDPGSPGPWVPVVDEASVNLTGPDGTKEVYARFRGQYGLLSPVVNASVVLDTTPPDLEITAPEPDARFRNRRVTVAGTAHDASGLDGVEISLDGGEWTFLYTNGSWSTELDLGSWGAHTITVRATDDVGHFSESSVVVRAEEEERTRVYDNPLLLLVVVLLVVVMVLVYLLLRRGPSVEEGQVR